MSIQFNPNLLPNDAPDSGLVVKHLGTPVISHPSHMAAEQQAEQQEEEQGRQAYQQISNLFDSLDEVDYGD